MNRIIKYIESLGGKGIRYFAAFNDFINFTVHSVIYILNPKSYNFNSLNSIISEFYLSCVRPLFLFIVLAIFLGSAFVSLTIIFALNYNLQDQVGKLLTTFLINEFAPFFTVFFIILNYGVSLHLEISKLKNDLNNIFVEVYLPKLVTGSIAVPAMSLLFATIMLISGFTVSSLYLNIDLDTYKRLIVNSIMIENILILLLKGAVFGIIGVIIPLFYSYKVDYDKVETVNYIMKILTSVFVGIFFIEILFLLVIY